jgi:predicted enzyme related to lactoylglutathione lyase
MDMTGKPGGPSGWFTYMAVDDVDARVVAAEKEGAVLCMPVFEVPTVGRIAILQDPTGAMIGWMKPEMPA